MALQIISDGGNKVENMSKVASWLLLTLLELLVKILTFGGLLQTFNFRNALSQHFSAYYQ